MAATCALYGSVKFGRRKRSSGGPDGGSSRKRHAVVL